MTTLSRRVRAAAAAAVLAPVTLLGACSGGTGGKDAGPAVDDACSVAVAEWFIDGKKRASRDEPAPASYEITGTNDSAEARTCEVTLTYADDKTVAWVVAVTEGPGGFYVHNGWPSPDAGTADERAEAAAADAERIQEFLETYRDEHGKNSRQVVLAQDETRAELMILDDKTEIRLSPGNSVYGYGPKAKSVCVVHSSGAWARLDRVSGEVASSPEGTCTSD